MSCCTTRSHATGTKAPATFVKNKGGRPATAIPQGVVIEVGAWLAADGVPDTLAKIEGKIRDLMQAKEYDAANRLCASALRNCASNTSGILVFNNPEGR